MITPYLTRPQAAEYANVSVSTIDRAIHDGLLRAAGAGNLVRIRPEWVDAWLEQMREPDQRYGNAS